MIIWCVKCTKLLYVQLVMNCSHYCTGTLCFWFVHCCWRSKHETSLFPRKRQRGLYFSVCARWCFVLARWHFCRGFFLSVPAWRSGNMLWTLLLQSRGKGAVVLTDLLGSSLVPFTFWSSRKTCALQWRSVLLSYLYLMYAFMDPAHELTIFFVDM